MTALAHRRRELADRAAAFTLIELLAVMLIIGILMAMILGVATWAMRANLEAKARADIEVIQTGLTRYKMDVGNYPATGSWTNDLRSMVPPGFTFRDPWKHAYQYTLGAGSATYRLYSRGADGAEGPPPTADADNILAGRF